MAILNGIIKKLNGSAGQLTFKTVNGQTVVSEKVTAVKNSRTNGQQRQRMKWVNIIHMYSGISPLLKNGFEKKSAQQSDYNMFVKMNNAAGAVYLTKTDADGGGCVAAPYQLTQGSLPSIVVTGTGAQSVTDIALGSLVISATTTVAQFAQAVVNSNADYDYGDQISFYNILQKVNAETGVPYCQFAADYVVLDKDSTVLLWSLVNQAGFATVNGYLGHGASEGDGVFAWVHSRYENGKTKVSTQFLIDNNSKLAAYKDDAAYTAACKSYGGNNKVFLTPGSADTVVTTGSGDTSGGGSNNSGGGSSTPTMKTLTLSVSPAGAGTVTGAGQYTQGTNANITATAASGYTFTKWSDNNTSATRNVTVNGDMTLVAQFTAVGGGDDDQGGDDQGGGDAF